jgi:hypothetical protein
MGRLASGKSHSVSNSLGERAALCSARARAAVDLAQFIALQRRKRRACHFIELAIVHAVAPGRGALPPEQSNALLARSRLHDRARERGAVIDVCRPQRVRDERARRLRTASYD